MRPSLGALSRPVASGPFERAATALAHRVGKPQAFLGACVVIAGWAAAGPLFHYSDTWQLVINTGTTIVTFLMVFVIQNTQNRDAAALQIKLDELIRATRGAHNALLDLERLSDEELEAVRARYEQLAGSAREALRKGRKDTGAKDKPGLVPGRCPRRSAKMRRWYPSTRSS